MRADYNNNQCLSKRTTPFLEQTKSSARKVVKIVSRWNNGALQGQIPIKITKLKKSSDWKNKSWVLELCVGDIVFTHKK